MENTEITMTYNLNQIRNRYKLQYKMYQGKSRDLSPHPRRLHELSDLPAPQDPVQDEQLDSPETWLFLLQISLQSETERVCQFLLHEEFHENVQRYHEGLWVRDSAVLSHILCRNQQLLVGFSS